MIDLTVTAADDEQGMTLGELRTALDRAVEVGADQGGPVRVFVSRLHGVRRVEVSFPDPTPGQAPPAEPPPAESLPDAS